jgi:threonine dehydrogenase-like Zn-dependent dehydrogenase
MNTAAMPVAMVQHGARDLAETALERPSLEAGAALLRVEACGLCGSDIEALAGYDNAPSKDGGSGGLHLPRIMGHEIIGVVEEVGPGGRRDVQVGDRVAVDPWLPCGGCEYCLSGLAMHCTGWDFSPACYGFISVDTGPGLWGGYATHLYAHPKAVLYPIPEHVGPLTAALWNPMAAGIQWAVLTPRTALGSTVVILGCGQRGLTSVVAAKAAGASTVVVTGLPHDAQKLELARAFGADLALDVGQEDVVERVRHITGGRGADVVVDTSSSSTQPVTDSLELVRPAGTIVWAGLKAKGVPDFPVDRAVLKGVRIQGVLGMSSDAYRHAIALLASGRVPLDEMRTHVFDFREAVRAVDVLAGADPHEQAINVVLSAEQ